MWWFIGPCGLSVAFFLICQEAERYGCYRVPASFSEGTATF